MSFLHAAYSGGAVAGALIAGALLSAGMDYRLVYLSLLAPLAALAFARFPLTDAQGRVPEGTTRAAERDGAPHWDLYWYAPLLLVATIAALGLMAEGLMETWSGIYLRDFLGALLGGSGVAGFFGGKAAGRLATGWVVGRVGNRKTLVGGGLLAPWGWPSPRPGPRSSSAGSWWWASRSRGWRPWPSRWRGTWCQGGLARRSRW